MSGSNIKDTNSTVPIKLIPSQLGSMMRAIWLTDRSPLLWGPPGIGKSEILQQQATAMGVAFIDIRLGTKNPSQIAGVPFPHEDHGQTLLKYSIPAEFPRDIDIEHVTVIRATETRISFSSHNPKGSNKIHYCRTPVITVEALDENHVASITASAEDYFIVVIHDETGKKVAGEFKYTIKAKAKAILCFDELSSANPSVQAVAYSLINDRRLGEYIFPEDVKICAAANRKNDRGVHYELAEPLQNRFTHYELESNWKDWVAYARHIGAYLPIIYFHEHLQGKALTRTKPTTSPAWESPRSWMILSDLEYAFDKAGVTDDRLRLAVVTGTIGETHAAVYVSFKNNFHNIPSAASIMLAEDIPEKKYTAAEQKFIVTSVIWAMRNQLKEITEKVGEPRDNLNSPEMNEFYSQADNAFMFFSAQLAPDMIAGAVKTMSNTYKFPLNHKKMPHFQSWLKSNSANIL